MSPSKVTISTASRITGVSPKTLRYYEEIGLVSPAHAENGYRVYDADCLERVRFVLRAKGLGFTLNEIAAVLALRDSEISPCDHVAAVIHVRLAEIEDRMKDLAALKTDLETVRDSHARTAGNECGGSVCHLIEDAPLRKQHA